MFISRLLHSTSLRRSLVIPAIAIMLFLSLGVAGIGYWAGNSLVNLMSEQLIRHMSTSIRDHLSLMMESPPRMLKRVQQTLARHPSYLRDPVALARELYALLDDEPGLDWLYFANEDGGLVSIGRLEKGKRVALLTDGFRAGTVREYDISADGTILGVRKTNGYFDPRQREWYQTAKRTGASCWTKPYIGAVEPILGISLSVPVPGEGGKLAGVYGLDLILTRLSDFMKRQHLGRTGRAFVMDDAGYLIASSGTASPVVIDRGGRQRHVQAGHARDQVVRAAARHLAAHPELAAHSLRKGMRSFRFRDRSLGEISAAADSFVTANGASWLVVSALPMSEFQEGINSAAFLSLALMTVLIAAALAGGFWAVNRVLRPVESLTAAAHVIADGGWPEVPETGRADEIGVLARALDNMTRTLRSAHAELESQVSARTADLNETIERLRDEIEERIRTARALEAETAARLGVQAELHEKELLLLQQSRLAALGEMIGNIAHQWRQPLNLLGLLAQELPVTYRRGDFNKEYLDESVGKMLETIRHMSRTIDDFRNFTTPEKEKTEFHVPAVIRKTVSLLEGSLRANGIEAALVAEGDPVVAGFPNQFAQALLNILINARDALVANAVAAPKITITVKAEEGSCIVTVADNAGGVPEAIMGRIFEPYFTTKGPDKGTGIGLYMTRIIIEKNMGGRITVRNSGDGAEFRMVLPSSPKVLMEPPG